MKNLRNAGIAVIASLLFAILSFVRVIIKIKPHLDDPQAALQAIAELSTPTYIVISLILGVLIAVFIFQGFITLGKKFNNKLMIISGWALMVILIANELLSLITSSTIQGTIFVFLFSIFILLLGVSLTKIKQKVKLANPLGIFYIITGVAFLIGKLIPPDLSIAGIIIAIGLIALLISLILAAAMFFKVSRQVKE